ncbi:MAG TPA: ABC transporter ATP-binding protein [Microvirga sp.]|jgi:ABC-2 type transport system ATP-binding protein|nr:ABC transporter ATP-binding protein [Microvirga sp.]
MWASAPRHDDAEGGSARRAEPAPIASLEKASLALGRRPVLVEAELALRRGEIYVLLGPNGAGKTSLLRALCGRLPLTGGTALVGDPLQDPRRHARARRLIGFVPQEIALYPRLTVRENVEVFAELSGVPRSRAAEDRVLRITSLEPVAGTLVANLSGGQQRRVNIAVALVAAPQILLLDEPTVGIDLDARGTIHDVLLELRAQGVAIMMITHDFDQAERLADRAGILVGGRIVTEGRPADILKRAFGSKKQVEAVLVDLPEPGVEAELRDLGFRPVDGRLLWTGLSQEGASASHLLDRLQASRIPVREVRIREPGLDALFRQVAGEAAP